MPYASLRDFIGRLEAAGRLKRVAAPVSPYLWTNYGTWCSRHSEITMPKYGFLALVRGAR